MRHGKVGVSIAIEVCHDHEIGALFHGVGSCRLKRAVAVAPKHRYGGGRVVGRYEVEMVVAVEVRRLYDLRTQPCLVRYGRLQAAVAVPQQDVDSAEIDVGSGYIQVSVFVKVAYR